MENLISRFMEKANNTYDDADRKAFGIGDKEARDRFLDEHLVEMTSNCNKKLLREGQGESTIRVKREGRLDFVFEDSEDAYDLYSFMTGHDLLSEGEIEVHEMKSGTSVSFSKDVMENKTDLVAASLLAFEKQLDLEEEEDLDVLESVVGGLTDIISEASTSGAPKTGVKGNPFHNRKTGKFSSSSDHIRMKGGSWSNKKTKLKFTGKGKSKTGGAMAKYGSTKHPCGRAAREQGKDIRCWDGNKGLGLAARISRIMKGKKPRKLRGEGFDISDMALLMEVRQMYNR